MKRHRTRVLLVAIVLATAMLALTPSLASAGRFTVQLACDTPDGWRYETNNPSEFESGRVCPVTYAATQPWGRPASGAFTGTYARVRIAPDAGQPGTGARAALRLQGPASTRIIELVLRHWLGMEGGSGWTLYGRTSDGDTIPGVSCTSSLDCDAGGPDQPSRTIVVDTESVELGFECFDPIGTCTEGGTIHDARVAVYSTWVTLNDPTGPVVGAETGELVDATRSHQGIEAARVSATDATGIKEVRVYLDGHSVTSTPRACDYTRMRPCTDATPTDVVIDTRRVTNGLHTLRLAAIDAAGNETLGPPHRIMVDNPDPSPPPPASPRSDQSARPAEPAAVDDTGTVASPVSPATPLPAMSAPTVGAPFAPPKSPRTTTVTISRARRVARGTALAGETNLPTGAGLRIVYTTRARRLIRRVTVRKGRWACLVTLPRRLRDASATAEVRFDGDERHASALARKRIARKR